MTHLPRLSESGDAFDAHLLRAARAERPREETKRKVIAELGLVAAGLAVERSTALSFWKWFGTGAVSVAVAVAGAAYVSHVRQADPLRHSSTPTMAPLPAPAPAASVVALPAPEISAETPPPEDVLELPDVPDMPDAPAVRAPARRVSPPIPSLPSSAALPVAAPASAPVSPSTTLPREIDMLAAAKASLKDHAPDAALATLKRYEQTFPKGALAEEAEVLRVEALSAAGRKDEAASAAWLFQERHPKSPYTVRVKSLLQAATR